MSYVAPNGCEYEDYSEYVMTNVLGLCGCCNDALVQDIKKILSQFLEAEANSESLFYDKLEIEGPPKYKELILHVLDNANLIEHGASIRGSWFTPNGSEMAQKLSKESAE